MEFFKSVCCCLLGFFLSIIPCYAGTVLDEEFSGDTSKNNLTVLAPVTVVGTVVDHVSGKNTLTENQIRTLPQGNGSVNELLTVMPSVQTSDMANSSLQGGEILPPSLSISGGRFYENNFVVDGIGNNSLLDPAVNDPEAINDLPGFPQELFLDSNLIGEVTVYSHNIPVEFGGFTGGVVDVHTRMPGTEFSGKIDLRTTRSNWTRFHLDSDDKDAFENSSSVDRQPHFKKYNGGILCDLPFTENMGLLASYRKVSSKIPLQHFDQKRNQSRELDTYFFKYAHSVSDRTTYTLSYIQTPYEEKRFREMSQGSEIKNSWYTLNMDSYQWVAEARHFFNFGEMEVSGAYKKNKSFRDAPKNYFNWRVKKDTWVGTWSKDWGTLSQSKEGGYGNLETTQESETLKTSVDLEPLVTGPVSHSVKIGYGFERVTGTFERKDDSSVYTVAPSGTDPDIICNGDIGCVDNEQYAAFRTVYEEDSIDATIDFHHIYLQDQIEYRRLTLRPGIRFSKDNFMENDDLDLRLAASLDLFGTASTILVGGVNRYHGKPLLAYKLAEGKKPNYTEKRSKDAATNTLTPWVMISQSKSLRKYSELKTPYSDEWTVGVDQVLLGGILKLNYFERRNKDEFASTINEKDAEGYYYTTLNNNGRSKHKEATLEWERSWKKHYLALNATWQRTESSNDNYRDVLEDEELNDMVYYDGELIKMIDLPRSDYNRAYVGNLIYSAALPYGFAFTNRIRYRSAFKTLEDSGEDQPGPDGIDIPVYEKVEQSESWIFDWELAWRQNIYRQQGIQFSVEVYNVFDKKVPAGTESEIQTYEMGRQFWAGMEYYF